VLTFPTSKIGQMVSSPVGMVPYGLTPYAPIENQYVLDANEITLTKDYVNAYNVTIKSIAQQKGLAVFDAFTFLNDIKAHGILVDGVSAGSSYISGGIFSLDGVHLTPRGYALVANEYIKAINKTYNASIPTVNISNYRGVKFPN
jgi:lysophospholipase L1-like esterase